MRALVHVTVKPDVLDPQGRARPVLQYVAPSDFQRLRAPLLP